MSNGLELSWNEMKDHINRYAERSSNCDSRMIDLYREIYKIWFHYFGQIYYNCPFDSEKIKQLHRDGRFLLSETGLDIDKNLFRQVLNELIETMAGRFPEAGTVRNITRLEDINSDWLSDFLSDSTLYNQEKMQQEIKRRRWDHDSGVEAELVAFLFFSALTPFYVSFARAVLPFAELSLWREGYCPVCGQKPAMAKLRAEDGARILECWLCHVQWQFPRLECPFCDNKDFKQMKHFYTEEYRGYRVQLCDRCKNYLKTVVEKEFEYKVVLELANVFTIELDHLARREGYRPGEDLALLA